MKHAFALAAGALWLAAPAFAQAIWLDGAKGTPPVGKLLSDNPGYWGESVRTGVRYTFEGDPPDSPADTRRDDRKTPGRRLLDGEPAGIRWTAVGVAGRALVARFDFGRDCTFAEIDLSTRSRKVGMIVEVRSTEKEPWRKATEWTRDACPDRDFHRLILSRPAKGRFLRLTVDGGARSELDEIWAWGEATGETVRLAHAPDIKSPFVSFPGVAATGFDRVTFTAWRNRIGPAAGAALFSLPAPFEPLAARPLLPEAPAIVKEATLVVARNETELIAVAVTNPSAERSLEADVRLTPFRKRDGGETRGIHANIRLLGWIPSRTFGVGPGPLIGRDDRPGETLLRSTLTNAAQAISFPKLTLPPGGSAILWITVATDNAAPGVYETTLSLGDAAPSLPIRVEALAIALPNPRLAIQGGSQPTAQRPFVLEERLAREVAFRQSLGLTVWDGFPEKGTAGALARSSGPAIFRVPLSESDVKSASEIAERVRRQIDQARALGLDFGDWYLDPDSDALAKSARRIDSRLLTRTFAVDSAAGAGAREDGGALRFVRYGWAAFTQNASGWGFESYFAPHGNPWDDFDEEITTGENAPDRQIVYPGPRGPLPTLAAAAVREGVDAYRLLRALSPGDRETILAAYAAGQPLGTLREKALRLLAP